MHFSNLVFAGLLLSGIETQIFSEDSAQAVFTKVYDEAHWGRNERGEGYSGTGSLVRFASEYMIYLQNFLSEKNIQSVVDIGCGDWEFSKYVDWKDIAYKGLDVVPSVIDKNIKNFSSPSVSFACVDVIHSDLPIGDLMLCKDVLQHLTNSDILALIKQIGKYKYCLITNDVNPHTLTSDNSEILWRGNYRPLDLTKPPYNLKGTKVLTYRAYNAVKQVLLIDNTKGQTKFEN